VNVEIIDVDSAEISVVNAVPSPPVVRRMVPRLPDPDAPQRRSVADAAGTDGHVTMSVVQVVDGEDPEGHDAALALA
jgi:hypothetical protein